jgi:sterol desaturase/sphingolipid hydroxylase (fatty acid hydroxylase superfamily)
MKTQWGLLWWYVLVLAFAATAVAETFLPFRPLNSSTPRRWLNNAILLAVSNVTLICIYRFSGIALAISMRGESHGFLNRISMPYWAKFAIGFAALDLVAYLSHRLLHAFGVMWRMHRVHHSENDLDLTTGFRFHPLETLFTEALALSSVALVGTPPAAVGFVALAIIVQDFFTHGNVRIPESADGMLRWLIITPSMHRVHHSEEIADQSANFGTMFSLWDRLFGTYRAGHPAASARYGLADMANGSDANAARLLLLPFHRELKQTSQETTPRSQNVIG